MMENEDQIKRRLIMHLDTLHATLTQAIEKIRTLKHQSQYTQNLLKRIKDARRKCSEVRTGLYYELENKDVYPSEIDTIDEYQKFKKLPPITKEEIKDVDWRKLLGEL